MGLDSITLPQLTKAFTDALGKSKDEKDSLAAMASSIKFGKDGMKADPKAAVAKAKAKNVKILAKQDQELTKAVEMKDAVGELKQKAISLESAFGALTSNSIVNNSVYVTTTATMDSTLTGAAVVKPTEGAAMATHSLQVNSLAKAQQYVLSIYNTTSQQWGFRDPTVAANIGTLNFVIKDAYGNTSTAAIGLGDSLEAIATKINAALATPVNIAPADVTPIAATAYVTPALNGVTSQLVIKSNDTGNDNFILLQPSAPLTNGTINAPNSQTIDIYNLSAPNTGWAAFNPAAAAFTGGNPAFTQQAMKINGEVIDLRTLAGNATNQQVVDLINSLTYKTNVSAGFESVSGINVIRLSINDPAGINLDYNASAPPFSNPSIQLVYRNCSNAEIEIDGIPQFSNDNTFTDPIDGIDSITVNKITNAAGSMQVGPNADAIKTSIQKLVDSVNDVQQFIAFHSQVDEDYKPLPEASLYQHPALMELQRNITGITDRVAGITAGISSILDIGISFTNFAGSGVGKDRLLPTRQLVIDDAKLSAALADPAKLAQVRALFDVGFTSPAATVSGAGITPPSLYEVINPGFALDTSPDGLLSSANAINYMSAQTVPGTYDDLNRWKFDFTSVQITNGAITSYKLGLGGQVFTNGNKLNIIRDGNNYNISIQNTNTPYDGLSFVYTPNATELASGSWTRSSRFSFLPTNATGATVTFTDVNSSVGAAANALTVAYDCSYATVAPPVNITILRDAANGPQIFQINGAVPGPNTFSFGILNNNPIFSDPATNINYYKLTGQGIYQNLNFMYAVPAAQSHDGFTDTFTNTVAYHPPIPPAPAASTATLSLMSAGATFNTNNFNVSVSRDLNGNYTATGTADGQNVNLNVQPMANGNLILSWAEAGVYVQYNPGTTPQTNNTTVSFTGVTFSRGVASRMYNYLDNYANSDNGWVANTLTSVKKEVSASIKKLDSTKAKQAEEIGKIYAKYLLQNFRLAQMQQSLKTLESMYAASAA